MTSIKSITLALVVAATSMTALAPMAEAAGLPNLKPGFNTKTGKLTVKNTGLAKSGKFVATISCSASGGGSCPFHNAHLQAGIANGGKLEYQTSATGAYDPLFDNLPTIEDGWLALPQTPGFGFTPNKDAMKEFTVK